MKVNIVIVSKSLSANIIDGDNALSSLGELRDFISNEGNLDRACLKVIHRGKTLNQDDDTPLSTLNFKENDKLLVMGKANAALKDDPGFSALLKYEKDQLIGLQTQYDKNGVDLTGLEKKFLDDSKLKELAKRLDNRLKMFAEICVRHLESVDGLPIIRDDTREEQKMRNREKRKALVNGIQALLNLNDKYMKRLEEFNKKLSGEIVE